MIYILLGSIFFIIALLGMLDGADSIPVFIIIGLASFLCIVGVSEKE